MTNKGGVFNLTSQPTHCGLCFGPFAKAGGNQIGGLLLCDPCNSGALQDRVEFRGFRFGEKINRIGSVQSHPAYLGPSGLTESAPVAFVASQVNMTRCLPLKAKFFPQKEGGGFLSLFRRELQAGDALFDQSIYIESKRDEVTHKLLSSSGLQSAIMEVVFDTGKLVFDGHVIRTQKTFGLEEAANPETIRRNLAVVAHYLDIYCQHLERPHAVSWP